MLEATLGVFFVAAAVITLWQVLGHEFRGEGDDDA